MKKQFMIATVCLSLAACGNKKEGAENSTSTDSTASSETKTEEIKEDASIIDPAKDDLSKPITTTQLLKSMSVYYGKPVQMVVYPFVYVDQEKCKQDMRGMATPDGETAVSMKFATVPDLAIAKGKPYLLKGTITEVGYSGELYIKDAALSAIEGEPKTGAFNPKAISGDVVYNTQDIINSIKAWDKKAVTVTGDYWGSTVSRSADKKKLLEVRVDLQLASDEVKTGCAFATEEEIKALQPGQKNVTIQGEMDYKMHYGGPYMVNCKIVQ